MQCHQLLEYHDQRKLDPAVPADKELIETYLGSRFSAEQLTYDNLQLKEFFKWQ